MDLVEERDYKTKVDLEAARDALPCTAVELADAEGASHRAAKRALQYLVHLGLAAYDESERRYY